jgi:hypothetical protein
MKLIKSILFFLIIGSQTVFWANDELTSSKPLSNPLYREYMNSRFNVKFYQGFGFRHFAWDFDVSYQFRQYFSIGIGNGFHRNKYPIFSTSDKHVLNMWSYALYFTGNVFLIANSDRAFYIYGKYGRQFAISSKNVRPTNGFESIIAEGGLGYQIINGNKNYYFELGQYYTNANGIFYSTYDSEIKYDLQIFNVIGKIGFRLSI